MANELYDKAREGFLEGSITWTGATITAALALDTYNPVMSTDEDYTPTVAPFVATMGGVPAVVALTTLTVANGVAGADNPTFPAVDAGQDVVAIVLYDSTSDRLIAYIDTATGLPIAATDGGDLTVHWDTGSDLIFRL